MKSFINILKREIAYIKQDKTLRSIVLLAPILYAIVIGFVYQSGKVESLPINVVDNDNSPMSVQMIEMLSDNEKLHVVHIAPDDINANNLMIQNKAVATIIIPDQFEADILQKRYPEILTYVNTTNLLTANMASTAIQVSLGTMNAGIEIKSLMKKGMTADQASANYEPFKVNFIRMYNPTANYFTYMWPGILAVVFQQVLLLGLAVSFSKEYKDQKFTGEVMAISTNPFKIVLGKMLPYWLIGFWTLGIYYIMHIVFHAPIPYSLITFIPTAFLFIVAVTSLGVLVSAIFPDALKATQVLMLISTPAFIIGGYSWPTASMPIFVQGLANIIPLTPFLNAHKMMLLQEASLSQVHGDIFHLLLLAIIYFVGAIIVTKMKFRLFENSIRKNKINN